MPARALRVQHRSGSLILRIIRVRLRIFLAALLSVAVPSAIAPICHAQYTPPTLPPGTTDPVTPNLPPVTPSTSPGTPTGNPPPAPQTAAPPAEPPSIAPPPKIALPSLLPETSLVSIDGTLDARYRTANTGRTNQIYLQDAELDVQGAFLVQKRQEGNIFFQVIGENPADVNGEGPSGRFEVGEAYATYRLPILTQTDTSSYLKIGQFVLPAGLLPVYDTHTQLIQSLYASGIGERTDWGIGVDGRFYGLLDYRFAVTAGVGPDHPYALPSRVVAFRLGRLFPTPYGTFNLGGSLLSGRLPVTRVDPRTGFAPVLPPSGFVRPQYGYEAKSRVIGDGQYTYRSISARGEIMTGADQTYSIFGYFIEGEYRFAPGVTVVAARSYFDYGVGGSTSGDNSVGLNLSYGENFVIRTLYEEQRNVLDNALPLPSNESPPDRLRHVFTVQVLFRF